MFGRVVRHLRYAAHQSVSIFARLPDDDRPDASGLQTGLRQAVGGGIPVEVLPQIRCTQRGGIRGQFHTPHHGCLRHTREICCIRCVRQLRSLRLTRSTGHPSAIHPDQTAIGKQQGREDMDTEAPVQGTVIERDRLCEQPPTIKNDLLLIEACSGQRRTPQSLSLTDFHHRRAIYAGIDDGPLFGGPTQLPDAEADRNGRQKGENDRGPPRAKAAFLVYHWFPCGGTLMRILIIIAFGLILFSLGSALFHLMRDKGASNRTVKALAWRVGFSIALFLSLIVANQLGWIATTGIRY